MHSLKDKFDELRQRIGRGRAIENTGSDPIFYLVFPVAEVLDVKRQTKAWMAKLTNDGWQVVVLSMAEAVNAILRENKLRKIWLTTEKQRLEQAERLNTAVDFTEINKTLSKALTDGPELFGLVAQKLEEAASLLNGLLLITDLEALHPYLRINTIEARIQGKVRCPVVVLYPGKREGKTSLRFLEFYPPDPNYRSEHIG